MTTTTSTMTVSSTRSSRRSIGVSFDTCASIRTYEVILGDHPRCCSVKRGGFPLTLGWNFSEDTKQIVSTTRDDDEDNDDSTTSSNSNADAGAGPDLSLSNTKKRSTLERLKLSVEDRKQRLMNVNDWSEEYLLYQEHQRLRRLKVEDGIHKHSQIFKLNQSSARPLFRRQSFLRHRDSLSHVTSSSDNTTDSSSDVADIILRQRERQQRRRSSEDGSSTTTTTMSEKQSSSSLMQQQSPRSVATVVLEAETTSSIHSSSSSSSSSSSTNNSDNTLLTSSSVAVVPVVPQTPQLMSLLY